MGFHPYPPPRDVHTPAARMARMDQMGIAYTATIIMDEHRSYHNVPISAYSEDWIVVKVGENRVWLNQRHIRQITFEEQ